MSCAWISTMICRGDLLKAGTAMPAKVSVSHRAVGGWGFQGPFSGELRSAVALFAEGRRTVLFSWLCLSQSKNMYALRTSNKN